MIVWVTYDTFKTGSKCVCTWLMDYVFYLVKLLKVYDSVEVF